MLLQWKVNNLMNNMMIGVARHKTKEEEKAVKKSEIAAIKSS